MKSTITSRSLADEILAHSNIPIPCNGVVYRIGVFGIFGTHVRSAFDEQFTYFKGSTQTCLVQQRKSKLRRLLVHIETAGHKQFAHLEVLPYHCAKQRGVSKFITFFRLFWVFSKERQHSIIVATESKFYERHSLSHS
jgi:hypothetical protein